MPVAEKLIIDADPGIGDALAIAWALCSPHVDVLALTATGGRVSGEDATWNLQCIVSLLDPDRWPRLGCSDAPATAFPKEPSTPNPILLNGAKGLGDCVSPAVALHHRHESAKLLVDLVRAEPQQVTLLTLGSLTNVKLACDLHSEFLTDLKALVCFGGSISGGGDVTAAAEFNIFADPEAARSVLTAPGTKTLVPLDVAAPLVLTFDQYTRWNIGEGTPLGRLLAQTIPYALRASRQHLGLEGLSLPELVALATVAHPRFVRHRPMLIDVELTGELTRGMTVVDRRRVERWQTNVDVVTEVEIQGVMDALTQTIRAAAGG